MQVYDTLVYLKSLECLSIPYSQGEKASCSSARFKLLFSWNVDVIKKGSDFFAKKCKL